MPRLLALLFVVLGLVACKEDKKLKVTGLDPTSGSIEGGDVITVKGNRFTEDGARNVKVYFAGKPADFLEWDGDSELKVRAPAGDKDGDKVDVLLVFEPGGEITLHQAYTYHETKKADVNDLDTSKGK